jgi:hypothetical protein
MPLPPPTGLIFHLSQNDSFFLDVATRLRQEMKRIKGPQVAVLCKSFAVLKFTDRDFYEAASHRLQQTVAEISLAQVRKWLWATVPQ